MDIQEALEQMAEGSTVYQCPNCDDFIQEGDLVDILECSNESCGEVYDGTNEGRNCPQCNRTFSRVVTRKGCSECLEEDECDEVDTSHEDLLQWYEDEEDEEVKKIFDRAVEVAKLKVVPTFGTKAEHIRYLLGKGMSTGRVREELGVSYQQVRGAMRSKGR